MPRHALPLPAPVVADLNGDGHFEIIVVTGEGVLEVLKPHPPGYEGDGFAVADILSQRNLSTSDIAIMNIRPLNPRPIALSVGYLDAEPKEKVTAPRKQVSLTIQFHNLGNCSSFARHCCAAILQIALQECFS